MTVAKWAVHVLRCSYKHWIPSKKDESIKHKSLLPVTSLPGIYIYLCPAFQVSQVSLSRGRKTVKYHTLLGGDLDAHVSVYRADGDGPIAVHHAGITGTVCVCVYGRCLTYVDIRSLSTNDNFH